jgi:predicted nucleic acid-binding Zn ribbon protein
MDRALTVCPEDVCTRKKWGRGKVKRLVSAGAGLLFKGSGFYITDYRSESYKEAARKESPAKAAEGKATESKPAESKPAASESTAVKPETKTTKPADGKK